LTTRRSGSKRSSGESGNPRIRKRCRVCGKIKLHYTKRRGSRPSGQEFYPESRCIACHKLRCNEREQKNRERRIWLSMLARCYNETHKHYSHYGGRGIKVCTRWKNDFDAFLKDMGRRPSDRSTIDRIDNDGNYTPENCRWVSYKTNLRNKGNNLRLTHNGETLTLAEWAERTGISRITIGARLRKGWTTDKALTTKPRQHLTYNGQTKRLTSWAREIGISPDTIRHRLAAGWSVERVLTTKKRAWTRQ
jgi:hypothetical protein